MGVKTSKPPAQSTLPTLPVAPDTPPTPVSSAQGSEISTDQFTLDSKRHELVDQPSQPSRPSLQSLRSPSSSSEVYQDSSPFGADTGEKSVPTSLLSLLSLPRPAIEVKTATDSADAKQIDEWKKMEAEAVEGDSLVEKRAAFFYDFRNYLNGNDHPLTISVQKPPSFDDDNNYAGPNVDGEREAKDEADQFEPRTFRVKLLRRFCGPFRLSVGLLVLGEDYFERDELGRVRELILRWVPQHGHFIFDDGLHIANANTHTRVQIEIGQVMEISVMTDFWLHWSPGYGDHWRQDFLATYGNLDKYKYADLTISFKNVKDVKDVDDGLGQPPSEIIFENRKKRRRSTATSKSSSKLAINDEDACSTWIESEVVSGKMTVDAGVPISATSAVCAPPMVSVTRYDEITKSLNKKNKSAARLRGILSLELVAAEESFKKQQPSSAHSHTVSWDNWQATMVVSFDKLLSLSKFVVSYELRYKVKVASYEVAVEGKAEDKEQTDPVNSIGSTNLVYSTELANSASLVDDSVSSSASISTSSTSSISTSTSSMPKKKKRSKKRRAKKIKLVHDGSR